MVGELEKIANNWKYFNIQSNYQMVETAFPFPHWELM